MNYGIKMTVKSLLIVMMPTYGGLGGEDHYKVLLGGKNIEK